MKKRLRKKKRVGEFAQLGFHIGGTLRKPLPDADLDAFHHRLLALVETRGLSFGGGSSETHFRGFLAHAGRKNADENDRAALVAFLKDDPALTGNEVGPLVDAWHEREPRIGLLRGRDRQSILAVLT